jgi:hypothetical protein
MFHAIQGPGRNAGAFFFRCHPRAAAGILIQRRTTQMTKLLEQAFEEASKLPPEEQDAIAAWLLEELASERRWSEAFAGSQDALSKLAAEAIAEVQNGDKSIFSPPDVP